MLKVEESLIVKQTPLVSIVIPVYNGANYLAEAIDSALAQTYKNIEIIVVNDGSIDEGETEKIALSYGDKIRYFQKKNGGCSSALNFGIRKAKGEFISWLSHDDLYDPNKIEAQVGYYEKYSLNRKNTLVSSSGRLIDENGMTICRPNLTKKKLLCAEEMYEYLLFGEGFNGCGLLIPRTFFDSGLAFREDMRFVLDWNLWQKLAICGASVYVDGRQLVANRMHSQQVTVKQKNRYVPELAASCTELFEILKDNPDPEFMRLLYCYCFSTEQPITKDMESYMREKNVSVKHWKKFWYVFMNRTVKIAKRLYHRVRRIRYTR